MSRSTRSNNTEVLTYQVSGINYRKRGYQVINPSGFTEFQNTESIVKNGPLYQAIYQWSLSKKLDLLPELEQSIFIVNGKQNGGYSVTNIPNKITHVFQTKDIITNKVLLNAIKRWALATGQKLDPELEQSSQQLVLRGPTLQISQPYVVLGVEKGLYNVRDMYGTFRQVDGPRFLGDSNLLYALQQWSSFYGTRLPVELQEAVAEQQLLANGQPTALVVRPDNYIPVNNINIATQSNQMLIAKIQDEIKLNDFVDTVQKYILKSVLDKELENRISDIVASITEKKIDLGDAAQLPKAYEQIEAYSKARDYNVYFPRIQFPLRIAPASEQNNPNTTIDDSGAEFLRGADDDEDAEEDDDSHEADVRAAQNTSRQKSPFQLTKGYINVEKSFINIAQIIQRTNSFNPSDAYTGFALLVLRLTRLFREDAAALGRLNPADIDDVGLQLNLLFGSIARTTTALLQKTKPNAARNTAVWKSVTGVLKTFCEDFELIRKADVDRLIQKTKDQVLKELKPHVDQHVQEEKGKSAEEQKQLFQQYLAAESAKKDAELKTATITFLNDELRQTNQVLESQNKQLQSKLQESYAEFNEKMKAFKQEEKQLKAIVKRTSAEEKKVYQLEKELQESRRELEQHALEAGQQLALVRNELVSTAEDQKQLVALQQSEQRLINRLTTAETALSHSQTQLQLTQAQYDTQVVLYQEAEKERSLALIRHRTLEGEYNLITIANSENQAKVTALSTELAEAEKSIDELNSQKEVLETQLIELRSESNKLQSKLNLTAITDGAKDQRIATLEQLRQSTAVAVIPPLQSTALVPFDESKYRAELAVKDIALESLKQQYQSLQAAYDRQKNRPINTSLTLTGGVEFKASDETALEAQNNQLQQRIKSLEKRLSSKKKNNPPNTAFNLNLPAFNPSDFSSLPSLPLPNNNSSAWGNLLQPANPNSVPLLMDTSAYQPISTTPGVEPIELNSLREENDRLQRENAKLIAAAKINTKSKKASNKSKPTKTNKFTAFVSKFSPFSSSKSSSSSKSTKSRLDPAVNEFLACIVALA